MNERRANMEMVGWDGDTHENTSNAVTTALSIVPLPSTRTLSLNEDSESDSDCPEAPPGHKGIKFNVADLTKLSYDSDVAKYNDWLADLKAAFKGDPAKFPNSGQKIIQASMTLEGQLKSTYHALQDAVAHAARMWLTLDLDEERRKYDDKKEKARSNRPQGSQPRSQQHNRSSEGNKQSAENARNHNRQDRQRATRRLSDDE